MCNLTDGFFDSLNQKKNWATKIKTPQILNNKNSINIKKEYLPTHHP
jgi:hypothetical protein